MKPKWLKIAGSVLPIVALGVSALINVVEKKELDAKIADQVAEALKNQAKGS